jgi:poly(A) polymerase
MAPLETPMSGGPPPRLTNATWLSRPETRAVFAAIEAGGHAARAVGGAVRNTLLGEAVKDVDIATTALPEEVMRLAEGAGLRAVATGIEHGTVTLVAHHVPFEVTTLRRDIETFGRHARVTFTKDWAEDARRRDFTMNALYCDAEGTLHDPLGGYPDLVARRVRFIGEPADRIREDYLRILRFFRFTAEYAAGLPDPVGLSASKALAGGMDQLSGERIRAELLRLLAVPTAATMLSIMKDEGILVHVLPGPGDIRRLARLIEIETVLARGPEALLRLAALASPRPGDALALRSRLRLSAHEYDRMARAAMPDPAFDPATPEREAKAFIYRHGAGAFTDGALIAWACSAAPTGDRGRQDRATLPSRWLAPALPVRGADVVALGVPPGSAVGGVIAKFEDWWIGEDFPTDASRIAAALRALSVVTKS